MHPFLPQHPLFKAYDIRGEYLYFTDDFTHCLSLGFAQLYRAQAARQMVIGYDVRRGSLAIAQQLAIAMVQSGIEVIWLGLVTTPLMAFCAKQHEGHGIVVTASHSPHHIAGIKWLVAEQSPSSADIQALYDSLRHLPIRPPTPQQLHKLWQTYQPKLRTPKQPISQPYLSNIQHALQHINQTPQIHPLAKRVVIDCLNGATSQLVHTVFPPFVKELIVLNDTPNACLPKGNPDPTEAGRLKELQAAVMRLDADIGLAFDGDGDRLMVVDNTGAVVSADHLLYLLAQLAINDADANTNANPIASSKHLPKLSSTHPNQPPSQPNQPLSQHQKNTFKPAVIFDVKCSHHLATLISDIGAEPIMSKTGSSHLRRALQGDIRHALFAGELSGHFVFNDGLFIAHDDGIYASIRLLNWLQKQPNRLSDIIAALPSMVSTADNYIAISPQTTNARQLVTQMISACQTLLTSPIHGSPTINNSASSSSASSIESSCIESSDTASNDDYLNSNQPSIEDTTTAMNMDTATPETSPLRQSLLAQLKGLLPASTRLTTVDGVRLDFDNGFGIIRQSNTSSDITVRFAGNTLADLTEIQSKFVRLCHPLDHALADKVANIRPNL